MDQQEIRQSESVYKASEEAPKDSLIDSETPPNVSEQRFGNETKSSERTKNHILTIRQVAKILEDNRIAPTERTILNWCHKNKRGIFRLDSFFDPAEAKYYITPESVQQAIGEEQKRLNISSDPSGKYSETAKPNSESTQKSTDRVPQPSESFPKEDEEIPNTSESAFARKVRELTRKNYQLEVENKAKDHIIQRYEDQQEKVFQFISDRGLELGELQQKVRQLESPNERNVRTDSSRPQEAEVSDLANQDEEEDVMA